MTRHAAALSLTTAHDRVPAPALPAHASLAASPTPLVSPLAPLWTALARAAEEPPRLAEVARWCAELGGVDPRLELAALRHARGLYAPSVVAEDVAAALRGRLAAAGPLLPARPGADALARMLVAIALDDVDPPAAGPALPERVARAYWQRARGFVAWSAARAVAPPA